MRLIEHLANDLGVSARQAVGGAGLLLQLAQQRLEPKEFLRLAEMVPAISDLIAKAPRTACPSARGIRQTVSRWLGGVGGLLPVIDGFNRLGCDKTIVRAFADSLIGFFRKQGGEAVGDLLRDALR